MKTLTNSLMIAAVAMAAVAGEAKAQSMKVEVPFSFQVSGKTMAPGSYLVSTRTNSGIPMFRLLNTDSRTPVLAMASQTRDQSGPAKLVFRCGEGGCALAQVWTGTAGAYNLNLPKAAPGARAMIEIKAESTKAAE